MRGSPYRVENQGGDQDPYWTIGKESGLFGDWGEGVRKEQEKREKQWGELMVTSEKKKKFPSKARIRPTENPRLKTKGPALGVEGCKLILSEKKGKPEGSAVSEGVVEKSSGPGTPSQEHLKPLTRGVFSREEKNESP